jgi:photosystem II stability/assembly factor-like uncharacterized protein
VTSFSLRPFLPIVLLLLAAIGPPARSSDQAAPAAAPGAPKWRMQYFYDQDKSILNLVDLQFPSATRGLAVGVIAEGNHQKPVAVVTSDGGAHWQTVDLEEPPVSLFFLNESLGWLVTTKGLWQTTETGKNWRKVTRPPGQIFRVCFTDENHGFAAGAKKKLFETHDGGKSWSPVTAAAEPPGNQDYSAYTWIAFASPTTGLVTGWNVPPRPQQMPDWMDPEAAVRRRDVPHLSYSLVTHDGGKSWKANSSSLFGEVSRVRFGPGGIGLGLIEYANSFRYPAEAYKIDWKTGASQTIYRDRHFAISDIWLAADGSAYLAGARLLGQVRGVVPSKVMVLHSQNADFTSWTEMPVDYRAVANRVMLAVVDPEHMWMATDGGMILKFQ